MKWWGIINIRRWRVKRSLPVYYWTHIGGGVLFIPMKVLVVYWSQKRSSSKAANFEFSTQLTWMGIKYFNCAALLDFQNATDSKTSNLTVFRMLHHFTDASFPVWFSILLQLYPVHSWREMGKYVGRMRLNQTVGLLPSVWIILKLFLKS